MMGRCWSRRSRWRTQPGIHRGTGPTDCRLQMATAAAVKVHRRSKAVGDFLFLCELILARVEKRELGLGQSRDGRACARGSAARPGIPRRGGRIARGRDFIAEKEETDDRKYQQRNGKLFHGRFSFANKALP